MDRIIELKAEIFDLQIQFGQIKQQIEEKLKEINDLNKNDGNKPTSI